MNSRITRRKFAQNYLKDAAVLFEMGKVIAATENDNFVVVVALKTKNVKIPLLFLSMFGG